MPRVVQQIWKTQLSKCAGVTYLWYQRFKLCTL